MDLPENIGQIIILVVFMVIAALKWVIDQARGIRPPEEDEPFEDLYEEARLEILERQNRQYPTEEEAQDKLAEYSPQPTVPPPPPPPLPGTTPPRPAYDASKPPPPVKKPALSPAEQRALQQIQERGLPATTHHKRRSPSSRVRELLSSPSSARDAIILSEILGPPKGVR